MTAYESGVEEVLLGREMGGDERNNIQRDAIDGDERVPPLADIRQRRRNISVELRNIVEGETVGDISGLFGENLAGHTVMNTPWTSAFRSERRRVVEVTDPLQGIPVQPWQERNGINNRILAARSIGIGIERAKSPVSVLPLGGSQFSATILSTRTPPGTSHLALLVEVIRTG